MRSILKKIALFTIAAGTSFAQSPYNQKADLSNGRISDYRIYHTNTDYPRYYSVINEPFFSPNAGSATIGVYGWLRASVGAASGFADSQNMDSGAVDGYYLLSSGTAANTGQVIYLGNIGVGAATVYLRVNFSSLSNAIYIIGFGDSITGSAGSRDHTNNGIEVIVDTGVGNTFILKSENGAGNITETVGSTTLSTNTWYNLRLEIEGSKIELYLNGSLEATVTTNIVSSTQPIRPLCRVNTLDTVNKQMKIDHFQMVRSLDKGPW